MLFLPPSSLALSGAAYYSVLIYKALNVILHVQVKGREGKREREKRRKERDAWRRIETERVSTVWGSGGEAFSEAHYNTKG